LDNKVLILLKHGATMKIARPLRIPPIVVVQGNNSSLFWYSNDNTRRFLRKNYSF